MKKLLISMMVALLLVVAVPFVSDTAEDVAGPDADFRVWSFNADI